MAASVWDFWRANRRWCMRFHKGAAGTLRVCTGSWLWEKNPLPHGKIESASVLRLSFRSDTLPAELSPLHKLTPLLHPPHACYADTSNYTTLWFYFTRRRIGPQNLSQENSSPSSASSTAAVLHWIARFLSVPYADNHVITVLATYYMHFFFKTLVRAGKLRQMAARLILEKESDRRSTF